MMKIKQFDVWIANLNPRTGTETGKTRPVVVLQTDLLNKIEHKSCIICPITTNVKEKATILRVHLKEGMANLSKDCDVMIDQLRAIDNNRLKTKIGSLPKEVQLEIRKNLNIILDLKI